MNNKSHHFSVNYIKGYFKTTVELWSGDFADVAKIIAVHIPILLTGNVGLI